jgi:hypothetical protein
MTQEPKSDFVRYAFGYSNKKPHWSFFVIIGAMAAYDIWAILSTGPSP